jgi:GntR family transcriptional regulator, arabinose operon transcriptional repressor
LYRRRIKIDSMIIDKNNTTPKYIQIQTWLTNQIFRGVFKPYDKIPTENELKKITGLARATIRQAIQNLVNLGYLERKRRLGTFVVNRITSTEKRPIIGILVSDIRSGYTPELVRGAQDEAAKKNHSLIFCNTDDLYTKADSCADRLLENSVSGAIFVPTAATENQNRQIIEKFRRNKIPVVMADRLVPEMNVDYVTTNNFEGAYEITKYLLERGHKKIGIILSLLLSTERLRLAGYKKALSDYDLTIDESLIMLDSGHFVQNHYYQYARNFLKKRKTVTAVFAGHDRIALAFYFVAKQMGIIIPNDISVVSYDDLHVESIGLTTMHQPIYEMGQESMKLILRRIHGENHDPVKIELKSYLVERSSVKSKQLTSG